MTRDDEPRETSAHPQPGDGGGPAHNMVDGLARGFEEQLSRAVRMPSTPIEQLDSTALAYVDHYLSMVRSESREPIVALVAAQAGAWFGEFVRRHIGGTWIGDGQQPRRLRLLLEPQFLHFSPIDLAYEAIFVGEPEPDDARVPEGTPLDGAFHLRKRVGEGDEISDHEWVAERLAEAAPVPEDQFYSLTGRFETLALILELLASRDLSRGREPTRYHLNDYVAELSETPPANAHD